MSERRAEEQEVVTPDKEMRESLTALFELFSRNLRVDVQSHKVGENTLFSNSEKSRGSRINVTLKLNRQKTEHFDSDNAPGVPLYFDFATVNNVMNRMRIFRFRERLEFKLELVQDDGALVRAYRMGTVRRRPEHLISDEKGTPVEDMKSSVRTKKMDSSSSRLDSVVFPGCLISAGVSSRCLETPSKKFAFKISTSNVEVDRWNACFPDCALPQALSEGFFVSTSRAQAVKRARLDVKGRAE